MRGGTEKFPTKPAALDKQHSNAEEGKARAMKGTENRPSAALAQGSIAFECFGLSRVRCAGYMEQQESSGSKRNRRSGRHWAVGLSGAD